ncbi:MAG: hypothetical protein ACTHMA_01510 [Thermomicrobiales bacterium]
MPELVIFLDDGGVMNDNARRSGGGWSASILRRVSAARQMPGPRRTSR